MNGSGGWRRRKRAEGMEGLLEVVAGTGNGDMGIIKG